MFVKSCNTVDGAKIQYFKRLFQIHMAPVVQKVDNAIDWINLCPLNSAIFSLIFIRRIVINPVDSAALIFKYLSSAFW